MKNLAMFLFMALGLCACGSSTSDAVAQNRTVEYGGGSFTVEQSQLKHPEKVSVRSFTEPAFKNLDASVGVEVLYTQGTGDHAKVKVTVTKEYADYFVAKVKNGTMTVGWDQGRMRRELGDKRFKVAARVEITAPAFHKLGATSGANVMLENGLDVNGDFEAKLTSGAILNADNVKATKVEMEANSGAVLHSSSVRCSQYKADVSAGGIVRVTGICCTEKAELEASSGAVMEVGFTESDGQLKAEASSGAVMEIKGKTDGEVELEASSGGMVRASSLKVRSFSSNVSSGGMVEKPSMQK